METQTLVALVGVGGALVGSAVGGLISFLSSRSVRKLEWEPSLSQRDLQARETLYAEFLSEASRIVVRQVDGNISEASDLSELLTLEAKLWFHSEEVGEIARKVVLCVLDRRLSAAKKEEPKEANGTFAELKHEYISACKNDLKRLKADV